MYFITEGYPGLDTINVDMGYQCSIDIQTFLRPILSASWLRHQMKTLSALLAICAGNSPVTGEFPTQRPVTRSFDFFFDLRLNKRLCKQSSGWWYETSSRLLWRYCNDSATNFVYILDKTARKDKHLHIMLDSSSKSFANIFYDSKT